MPRAYSQDLRERVGKAIAAGLSARAAAAQFSIGVSTAIRWAQRWRAEGHVKARAMGGDRRSRLTEHRGTVLTVLAGQPDLTLQELRTALRAEGIVVGLGTVWRFLAAQKITLKKNAARRRAGPA